MAHIQLSALLIILEIYVGAVLIETARPGTIVKRGGAYENAPQSIDEFKSRASEIEKVIDNMNEDDKKQLVERINEAVKKINPSGEMTQEAIYKVLLKKLDEWYESSNTKLTTGLFKTRNNTMRALNKLPMLKAAMGLGPMPLGYRLGGKQNQKTRKQRK